MNSGSGFRNKGIAEQESLPVLPNENRKYSDMNYKPFGKGLVVATLNINTLLDHIDEFLVFMNESDIDIISINETKLWGLYTRLWNNQER